MVANIIAFGLTGIFLFLGVSFIGITWHHSLKDDWAFGKEISGYSIGMIFLIIAFIWAKLGGI